MTPNPSNHLEIGWKLLLATAIWTSKWLTFYEYVLTLDKLYFRFQFSMTSFKTENRHGYSLKFSPHRTDLLAIATSQYYGFKGGGTLFLVTYDGQKGTITKKCEMFWEDGLFDVVWSRTVESLLVTGSGDGILQMWNYKHPQVNTLIYLQSNVLRVIILTCIYFNRNPWELLANTRKKFVA